MGYHNILIDALPKTVVIDGVTYEIGWGYRTHVLMEIAIFSDRNDEQKLLDVLNLFYRGNLPADLDKAVEHMLWFHRCGTVSEHKDKTKGPVRKNRVRAYCFEQDAGLIYAAFRSQYQINLNQTRDQELHWWEFWAMFDSLAETLLFCRVMYYRTVDLGGMGKSEKKHVLHMRARYALKSLDGDMDSKTKLAKRNAEMLAYVRKRMDACGK